MSSKIPTNPQAICWVRTCVNKCSNNKKYYPLPSSKSKLREIWLALATKTTKGVNLDKIFFCEDHFDVTVQDMMTINNSVFKSNKIDNLIPNKNMPDKVCRTCNKFMSNVESFYIMSNNFTSNIATGVSDELNNVTVLVSAEPLHHVFSFCFTEFVLPTDPIPIICGKCYYHLWLFFAFKKRAIYVEDFLGQDMTPEKYGAMVLCRTCPDHCSNFISIEQTSIEGEVLLKIFVNDYSPDVVPLRICLNCCNVLNKICTFYKNFMNVEEIMKRRALLNAKLNATTIRSSSSNISGENQLHKQTSLERVEKENAILVNLMIQFGKALKQDLHNIENWNLISKKLIEQGISCKVPSLIKNWKNISTIMNDKVKKNIPLSDMEKLVWQFHQSPNTNNDQPQTSHSETISDLSVSRPNINIFPGNDLKSPSDRKDIQNKNAEVVESNGRGVNHCNNTSINNSSDEKTITLDKVFIKTEFRTDEVEKKTDNSFTSFTKTEKLSLIDVMMKYKAKKDARCDDIEASHDIWPEIRQLLHERACTKDIESIKEIWHQMKEDTQNALSQNALTDDIHKLIANFLYKNKATPIRKKIYKPSMKRLLKSAKNSNNRALKNQQTVMVKAKNKGVNPTNNRIKRVGSFVKFEDKLIFAKAMSTEFDKLTTEEKRNRAVWKLLVKKVIDKYMINHSFNKLMNLWTKLKLSAISQTKDVKDPINTIIWDIWQTFLHEKTITSKNINDKNSASSNAENQHVIEQIDQSKSDSSKATPSISQHSSIQTTNQDGTTSNKAVSSTPHKRLIRTTNQGEAISLKAVPPSTSQKRSTEESKEHLPHSTLQKRPIEECQSRSSLKYNSTTTDIAVNQKLKNSANSIPVRFTSSIPESSSRSYQVLCQASRNGQKFSNEQLFLLIKLAYKELSSGELATTGHIWAKILKKIYDDGFQGLDKDEAKMTWDKMRINCRSEICRGEPSKFATEVHSFICKVYKEKIRLSQQEFANVSKIKKKNQIGKKKPYEVDSAYTPSRNISANIKLKKEETDGKSQRKASLSNKILFHINVDDDKEDEINKKKSNSLLRWSNQEKEDFLEIMNKSLSTNPLNDGFWNKVNENYVSEGYNRSLASIRQQWSFMCKRVETKIAEKASLNEMDKKIQDIIHAMQIIKKERGGPSTSVDKTFNIDFSKKEIFVSPPKKQLKMSELNLPNVCIDLTSCEYVSLEDIKQSTSWHMSEINTTDDKAKPKCVLSTVKEVGDHELKSVNKSFNYGDDNLDSTIDDNQRFVGATDIVGIEDISFLG